MIWILLVIMQFKHFIADYPLQGKYMLGKFKETGWVKPLAAHCAVHYLFTLVISFVTLMYANSFSQVPSSLVTLFLVSNALGFLDFTIHFIMDRIKASPKLLGKYKALSQNEFKALLTEQAELKKIKDFTNKHALDTAMYNIKARNKFKENTYFWYSLGLDQMVHHLTDLLIVFLLVKML
jgi:hypothetical protein